MDRSELLGEVSTIITTLKRPHPVRVGLDGIDAAGKTTLADKLAAVIEAHGRPVIRASVDSFHQPKQVRYRRGPLSPLGYYEDSFDYVALIRQLLEPLGPGGNRRYQKSLFDGRTEQPLAVSEEVAPTNAVLLLDGVFLFRPELRHYWDYKILVHVETGVAMQRAMKRDLAQFGTAENVQQRYATRYLPGQQLYYHRVRPQALADIILDNNNPAQPQLYYPNQITDLDAFGPSLISNQ